MPSPDRVGWIARLWPASRLWAVRPSLLGRLALWAGRLLTCAPRWASLPSLAGPLSHSRSLGPLAVRVHGPSAAYTPLGRGRAVGLFDF